jgi:quercetin dioxygenase-like cupin family protein
MSAQQNYQINRVSVIAKGDTVQVRELEVASDQEVPWHFHTEVTDHCYCLKGSVAVEALGADGEAHPPVVLAPGESCVVTAGTKHRVTCASGEVATYLLVQSGGKYDFHKVAGATK